LQKAGPAAPAPQVKPGENIVAQGAQARAGDELLPAGTALSRADCPGRGLRLRCRWRFSSGPAWPSSPPAMNLFPSSPRPLPARFATPMRPCWPRWWPPRAASPGCCPPPPTTRRPSTKRLAQAAEADLLLISGGVSAGKFDLVEPALARIGARFHFTGVRIQPGKPTGLRRTAPQAQLRAGAALSSAFARQSCLLGRHLPALRGAGAGRLGWQPGARCRALPWRDWPRR
jgi:hypothetical protein